ncbi:hypothetical protein COUCH_14800 [Couchioplanes caeruleus]|uniref:hypothetical protein n=1 Tax=Couchioplanes caeruleus TaxID=56438 RepID=UPI0020BE46B3|nr:hypothetical protein [Couchioplanes caeruleus]UQU67455.1 hypothetical protein COUCH_14800 [Couchioplanes caeruleus]
MPIGVAAVLTIAVVVLVTGALVAAWWMRHRMRPAVRPGSAGELPAAPSAWAAVQQARGYLWQEFDAIARLVAALPCDAPVFDVVPLLRDQVGIAAHGTDRLLGTVLQAGAGEPVLYDCSWQAVRVVSAAVQLRAALSAAARHEVDSERVDAAIVAVETAVDELNVLVTAALPPRGGPAPGYR